jgi:hypothetical protein
MTFGSLSLAGGDSNIAVTTTATAVVLNTGTCGKRALQPKKLREIFINILVFRV